MEDFPCNPSFAIMTITVVVIHQGIHHKDCDRCRQMVSGTLVLTQPEAESLMTLMSTLTTVLLASVYMKKAISEIISETISDINYDSNLSDNMHNDAISCDKELIMASPSFNYPNASTSSNHPSAILPGGGRLILKGKVSVLISAMSRYRSLGAVKNNANNDAIEMKSLNLVEAMEIYSISTGKGSQTLEHVSVVTVWESDVRIKMGGEVILVPGEVIMLSGTTIRSLIAEVRKDVLETLSNPEVLGWLEVSDKVLLDATNNDTRRLFRNLARAAEGMVTAVTGPSARDVLSFPSKLALARTIVEQFPLLTNITASNLFVSYSVETMKVMAMLDTDCSLILTVLTMLSFNNNLFTGCEWRRIGATDSYDYYWPLLSCPRK